MTVFFFVSVFEKKKRTQKLKRKSRKNYHCFFMNTATGKKKKKKAIMVSYEKKLTHNFFSAYFLSISKRCLFFGFRTLWMLLLVIRNSFDHKVFVVYDESKTIVGCLKDTSRKISVKIHTFCMFLVWPQLYFSNNNSEIVSKKSISLWKQKTLTFLLPSSEIKHQKAVSRNWWRNKMNKVD